jgi:hypothetical protein
METVANTLNKVIAKYYFKMSYRNKFNILYLLEYLQEFNSLQNSLAITKIQDKIRISDLLGKPVYVL